MDRQVSYNGPLSCSPLPCTFPASRPSIPMNHPFTPKPSISMYFHVYTPARKPATVLRDAAAQHIGHGKPIPVNNDRERPSAHNHTTASSGLLSGPHKDSVICPSSKGSYSPPRLATRGTCLSVLLSIQIQSPGSKTTMTSQATATSTTTSNHPIPMNYSHGYGTTPRVRALKLQWPSEVWITGQASTAQVQLHHLPQAGALEQGQEQEQKHLVRPQAANGPVLIQMPKTSISLS
jgi:hypothetical protein